MDGVIPPKFNIHEHDYFLFLFSSSAGPTGLLKYVFINREITRTSKISALDHARYFQERQKDGTIQRYEGILRADLQDFNL